VFQPLELLCQLFLGQELGEAGDDLGEDLCLCPVFLFARLGNDVLRAATARGMISTLIFL
jgi:hypothetical protein